MSQSPPNSPGWTTLVVRWGPAAIVFLELMIYSAVQAPVPGVNEPQYLGKAAHLWDPAWAAGDFFLESSNPHLAFYVAIGWLTRFLSLAATAWVARFAGYAILALGWSALAKSVTGSRFAAIPSAAIFLLLASIGNLSGEWLVGGIEGKVFSYGLMFLAIASWLDRRVIWGAVYLGAAVSFHPIVGVWGLICGFGAEIASRVLGAVYERPSTKTLVIASGLFLLTALPGALPATLTLGGAPHRDMAIATYIQVFWRLRHHLDPTRFSTAAYAGYAALFFAWVMLVAFSRRWTFAGSDLKSRSGGEPAKDGMRWALFVVAAVVIAAIGVAIGWHSGSAWEMPFRDLRGTLLKFYPFRLANVFVPLALSLAISELLCRSAVWRARIAALAAIVVTLAAFAASIVIPLPDRNPSRMSETRLNAWEDVAFWARKNTPAGTVLVTPTRLWGFKWFSHRAEYVNFKDSPQDAAGLLEWKRRLEVVRDWWTASPDGRYSVNDLRRLGDETGSEYLVTYAYSHRFASEPLYDNGLFRVYSLR
jgi:hypothetical protein